MLVGGNYQEWREKIENALIVMDNDLAIRKEKPSPLMESSMQDDNYRFEEEKVRHDARPVVVFTEELVDALTHFSVCSESLGCVYSSIFKSIHGNMIIWYGAWMKRSDDQKKLLHETLLSKLQHITSMAILLDNSFFNAYAGESKNGFPAAKFSTGDTILVNTMDLRSNGFDDNLPYLCLALFKSYFLKMEGLAAGVCFQCEDRPRVACLYVWKSLQACYSWLLNSDYRNTIHLYLEPFSPNIKYDIFKVVYVNSEDELNLGLFPPRVLENGGIDDEDQQKQEFEKELY
ncbi:uncharacterized protein LOC122093902 [Macadamia integrifolia]|uniref:uncharacterized protein LOC122093902 n=1 Tax=Macadamia integrifolia TaxID=60698 RepID=UPI001C52F930|nr:uncharacterized protein LOC122093902 [Macadamia integrifolia]